MALFYFNHRESLDLDFFSRNFNRDRVERIISLLSEALNRKIELIGRESRKNRAKILVYSVPLSESQFLKLDFVQDYFRLIKPLKVINGINVLALEDIYIRKILTLTGAIHVEDVIGRPTLTGGRQEAKDFYDLYCLSQAFLQLSDFCIKYVNQPVFKEAIIRWFNTYSRLDIKTGLLELRLNKKINYIEMERHFKKEIDTLIEREINSL